MALSLTLYSVNAHHKEQNNMAVYQSLLFLHIVAVAYWVGGMMHMQFAVRPTAVAMLEAPQRLPFLAGSLARFLRGVGIAVVTLLISGVGMMYFLMKGGQGLPASIHAMIGLGMIMIAVFGHIRFAAFPKLLRANQAQDWPQGAKLLAGIRRMVLLNIFLGVATIAVATLGRAWL